MKTITIKPATTLFKRDTKNVFHVNRDNLILHELNKRSWLLAKGEQQDNVGSNEARRKRYKSPFQEFRGKK